MKKLLCVFSHKLTEEQKEDAKSSLGVEEFIPLPTELQQVWSNIDPTWGDKEVEEAIQPILNWLSKADALSYVLVQGEFTATASIVAHSLNCGLIPVVATTARVVEEITGKDGSVQKTSVFKHVRFRRYANILGAY